METDNQATAGSSTANVGAGVLTCPAERSSGNAASVAQFEAKNLASCAGPPRRERLGLRVIVLLMLLALAANAQSGKTVRHHKVAVDDPSSPPELIQAESAIEKENYAAAEPLLRKVVAQDPDNFAAWFDLGFLYNALGKTEDSIAAYRKSVAAKPGVFESNLNLGLMLVKAGQPGAEQFLRAATKLKPTSHVAEARPAPGCRWGTCSRPATLTVPSRLTSRPRCWSLKILNPIYRPARCWRIKIASLMPSRSTS